MTAGPSSPSDSSQLELSQDANSEASWILEGERTPQRATVYWVLAAVLLLGGVLLRGFPEAQAEQLHFLTEVVATVLATLVGALALVRYYSKKETTFLFIGTGFLGTAFLDSYHLLVTSPLFETLMDPSRSQENLRAWSWIASRVFLSLFLFVSWLTWRQESARGTGRKVDERSVYITAALLTSVIFLFFTRAPLRPAIYPDAFVPRPAELIPALFFTVTLVGYFLKGAWRTDVFEHWLIVGLLVSALLHGAFAAFSSEPYDQAFSAAHLLKAVSYVAILVGLLASVFTTFRREESAFDLSRRANEALAREVAVRRQAERVLQESEERLQDFLDSANDLILMTQPDGTIEYVNRAWRRRLGYGETELSGRSFSEMVDPGSQPALEKAYEAAITGEAIAGLELYLRSSQEEEVIVRGSMNCRFEDGEPVSVRTMLRDVTEQKRAQQELAHSEANLSALVESTGDAIWSVGEDGSLITFNSAFALEVETLTGLEPRVGVNPLQLVPPDHQDLFRELYGRGLSGERFSQVWEVDLAGHGRAFELYFNPISGGARTVGVVVFSKDVTRRQRAEEALLAAKDEAELANQAKSQFLANMSHELRTPLNSVIGFANILLRKKDAMDPKEVSFLERILSNGKHLLELINEVLDLAKIEAGRMDVELEQVDLQEFLTETLGQMEGQIRGRPVQLVAQVPADLGTLETDPGKIKQVLINLVGNALKFTAEGSVTVEVEPDVEDSSLPQRIHIRDTGPGIPRDRLEAIFEAFQQADGSTARKYGGTGLGLSISRSLCHLLGYHVTVESELDVGSTFTINLNNRPGRGIVTALKETSGEADPKET